MKNRIYDWYRMHFYKLDEPEKPDWVFIMAIVVGLVLSLIGFYVMS